MNSNVFLILVFAFISTLVKAQDPIAIIRKYIELTGGEKNWNKVKTCIAQGYTWHDTLETKDSVESTKFFTVFREWPDKQRIDFYQNSILKETSMYSNGKGSISFQGITLEINTLIYYNFYPQQLLSKINSKDYSITLKSGEQLKNKDFYVIQLSTKTINEYYYFNKNTNLLEFEILSTDPDIVTMIADYRKVGEFIVPFKISKTRYGSLFFKENSIDIQLNVSIPDSISFN